MIKNKKKDDEYDSLLKSIWVFIVWLTGILVSLAVGFGMAGGILTVPWLINIADGIVIRLAGWLVVALTVFGVLLKFIDMLDG